MTLHDLIDTIEHQLRDELHCQAVIHIDPVRVGDAETDRLRQITKQSLIELDPRLTLHDFRITTCSGGTRLLFDVAAPYEYSLSDEELVKAIDLRLRKENPSFQTVIEIDRQEV